MLFLLALPFYLLPSGFPQPAYALVPLLALGCVFSGRERRAFWLPSHRSVVTVLALFVCYTLAVALVWVLRTGQYEMLAYPLLYAVNLLLFATVLHLIDRHGTGFLVQSAHALVGALVLQLVLLAVVAPSGQLRQTLFFNNPNQLGYFALLAATLLLLLRDVARVRLAWIVTGLAAASILCIASLSRSALGGLLILLLIALRRRPRALLGGALALLVLVALAWSQAPELARTRLLNGNQAIGADLSGRGYDRILNHPSYLLFGAGEGAFWRFDSVFPGELHSAFGTVCFAYGVPGSVLFALFLIAVLRLAKRGTWLLLCPVLAYGLVHQSLRFAMFWILMAFVCGSAGRGPAEDPCPRPAGGSGPDSGG
ncbi:MAG: hypothetical protein ACYDIE_07265 [Candidatus Krumholzibacteriia bacterium]